MQRGGKADITGDHEHQPAIPANPCHCLPERRAVRIFIVAEHDAGKARGRWAITGSGSRKRR